MKPSHFALMLSGFVAFLLFSSVGSAAEKQGKKPALKLVALTLKIENLTVKTKKAEWAKLEKAVKDVEGVKVAIVRKKKGELFVKHKPNTDVAVIRQAVVDAGFGIAEPKGANPEPE